MPPRDSNDGLFVRVKSQLCKRSTLITRVGSNFGSLLGGVINLVGLDLNLAVLFKGSQK